MEKPDLKYAKQLVSGRFLGRAGIHGVGMNRSRDAVCLYVDRGATPTATDLLPEIEAVTSPHKVEIIEESAPLIAGVS